MAHFIEYSGVYLIGAVGYTLIELLWRGFSHWTMALTGGVCFLLLYLIEQASVSRIKKAAIGMLAITSVELAVGFVVNILLGWQVWDYSSVPFNFCGQICLLYSLLWYLLCIPAGIACARLHAHIGKNLLKDSDPSDASESKKRAFRRIDAHRR